MPHIDGVSACHAEKATTECGRREPPDIMDVVGIDRFNGRYNKSVGSLGDSVVRTESVTGVLH